jgi:hypothetical protein
MAHAAVLIVISLVMPVARGAKCDGDHHHDKENGQKSSNCSSQTVHPETPLEHGT